MKSVPITAAWLLAVGLVTLLGCRMCCSPYDQAGPVLREDGRPTPSSHYRAGSILQRQPPVSHPEAASISSSRHPGHARKIYPKKNTSVSVQAATSERIPEPLGKPLTREEMEPFIDLGIPPENIISIEDRPLSEVKDRPEADSQLASAPSNGQQERSISVPKALMPSGSQPSQDGWTRLGSRTGTMPK
ncbi:hypothetical protein [Thermogutta sp.]|uniref:hypothetical protein n=1 Tax=Thermogutta sp. TaxID=1962930 RepID=UPI00321FF74E